MRYYKIGANVVVEMPSATSRDALLDQLTTALILFVEARGGFMGGGLTVTEVDKNGNALRVKPGRAPSSKGRPKPNDPMVRGTRG